MNTLIHKILQYFSAEEQPSEVLIEKIKDNVYNVIIKTDGKVTKNKVITFSSDEVKEIERANQKMQEPAALTVGSL